MLVLCFFITLHVAFVETRSVLVQTGKSQKINEEKLKAFEQRFLDMVGIKEKPQGSKNLAVPQYMLDLFNSRVRDPNYISTNMIFKDFATTANTVRSFYHKDLPQRNSGTSVRSKRSVFLDMKSIPWHEELVKAEFRVYKNRSTIESSDFINLYEILPSGKRELLDSKTLNGSTFGWLSYDILDAVKHWHKSPEDNYGVELEIMNENGHYADASHFHFDKPDWMNIEQWANHRPLFALYSRDLKTHVHKKRERRNASPSWKNYNGQCQRFDLVIDFVGHLKWDWVIQPSTYSAYLCKGKCVYPLADHMNATNHAMVQTLVHSLKKYRDKIPPACCVPTELESVMLLLRKGNSIELKDYPNMSVTSCGCR